MHARQDTSDGQGHERIQCAGQERDTIIIMLTSSCARDARFATCRHMIGESDVAAVHFKFVIHVYLGMHQSEVYELWIVRVVEAGSNIVNMVMTQVYSRAVM